jgi:hypothetical protein
MGLQGREMSGDRNWRSEIKKGYEIGAKSRGITIVLSLVGLAAAFAIPVAWYWCLAIYVAGMLVVGGIVTRDRRSPRQ